MDNITVVIVDDHPIFREGLINTISIEEHLEVVADTDNGDDALRLVRKHQPNVVVMDINMPGKNGQQVTREIVREKLPSKVILLTAYDDMEQSIHALKSGAAAYCAKHVQPESLVKIVQQVASGKYVVGTEVFDRAGLDRWIASKTEGAVQTYSDPGEPFHPLSKREMEVLSNLTKGMSNKEIANRLGISHQTVKNRVTSILRKLGVEERTQAAVFALKRGWFRLPDHDFID